MFTSLFFQSESATHKLAKRLALCVMIFHIFGLCCLICESTDKPCSHACVQEICDSSHCEETCECEGDRCRLGCKERCDFVSTRLYKVNKPDGGSRSSMNAISISCQTSSSAWVRYEESIPSSNPSLQIFLLNQRFLL